jgi:hypothetical protein
MTRATYIVEFPDGTRKYGIYNHSVDQWWPALRDTPDAAWELVTRFYYPRDWDGFKREVYCAPVGEVQKVRVADPYDDDWPDGQAWFEGRATSNALVEVNSGEEEWAADFPERHPDTPSDTP